MAQPLDIADFSAPSYGPGSSLHWSFADLQSNLNNILRLPELRDRRIAVQAGGNVGVFPKRLAQVFQRVYTFEPDPELFVHLTRNAPEPNIHRFQAALGDLSGTVAVRRGRQDGDMSRRVNEGTTFVRESPMLADRPAQIMRLDDLNLPNIDLVYLDVEGYELRALRGARALVEAYRPMIVVEINAAIDHVDSRQGLMEWLAERDYVGVAQFRSDYVFTHRSKF